jgi:ABC-type transporter Mla subunit MlaD
MSELSPYLIGVACEMKQEQSDSVVEAILAHGDQLGGNLVHLKRFLQRLQNEQRDFLREQRLASDVAQTTANRSARWSAMAAVAAALAAFVQAGSSVADRLYPTDRATSAAPANSTLQTMHQSSPGPRPPRGSE